MEISRPVGFVVFVSYPPIPRRRCLILLLRKGYEPLSKAVSIERRACVIKNSRDFPLLAKCSHSRNFPPQTPLTTTCGWRRSVCFVMELITSHLCMVEKYSYIPRSTVYKSILYSVNKKITKKNIITHSTIWKIFKCLKHVFHETPFCFNWLFKNSHIQSQMSNYLTLKNLHTNIHMYVWTVQYI